MSIVCETTNIHMVNLKKYINDIAKNEGFVAYKCDFQKVTTNGANNLGEIIEVGIKGETIHGVKEVNIFVKTKFSNENCVKSVSLSDVYSKELYAYKELSNIYDQLQEEANVPLKDRYKFVKCYDESNIDMIILEDITRLGYVNCDRYETISIDFARMCITQLAKFHGLSFVLEEKKMDYFNNKIKILRNPILNNKEMDTYAKNMHQTCLNHLEGEYKLKLESVSDIFQKYNRFVCNTSGTKCLCHGDYRTMNIMMKYTNGEITDVVPLDYQFLYYGLPAIDILFFIFGSTDREFRSQHLENLKDLYHDTMKEFLKYFEMDINLYYPKKEFYKTYEEVLEFGLIISLLYLPIGLVQKNEAVDFNKTSIDEVNFSPNKIVKARLEDVIDDYVEWGILK